MAEYDDYKTIRVSLHAPDLLVAHWLFPDGSSEWTEIEKDELNEWVKNSYDWEQRARNGRVRFPTRDIDAVAQPMQSGTGSSFADLTKFFDEIGKKIYAGLCPQVVQSRWNEAFRDWDGKPIRIIFDLARQTANQLASIPLETMYGEAGAMTNITNRFVEANKISIVRRVPAAAGIRQTRLSIDPPLRLLIFASNPSDLSETERLDVEGELRGIEEAIKEIGEDVEKTEIRPGKASFAKLVEEGPRHHVFHFIGHGRIDDQGEAQLLLETNQGCSDWRRASEITGALLNTETRLIVLNGCQTAAVSSIACQFPAVIGMQFKISDPAASSFAEGLYSKLADTGQLDEAVWHGRQKIREWGGDPRSEDRTPVLYMQSEDGLLLRIRPRILTNELPKGEVHKKYSFRIEAKGGRRPHSWEAKGLPPGLSMSLNDGVISGTPTAGGEWKVVVEVKSRDELGCVREFRLLIKTIIIIDIDWEQSCGETKF